MAYKFTQDGIFKEGRDGQNQLSNFTARIVKETTVHDGKRSETTLTIEGQLGETKLKATEVDTKDFPSMSWVSQAWGMKPVIMPIGNVERDLKTAIQMESDPETIDVYTHTGWTRIEGKDKYLHAGGAIDETGNDTSVTVKLPPDLSRYDLTPGTFTDARAAYRASLNLMNLTKKEITWPILLATYRAAIGSADFAIHISGRTGTFKSEMTSLFQSHYGATMDARHLPASWSSTANALECLAYYAKNALMAIDDFVPNGTSWQVRALQKTADQIIRGQGNQAGRARLTDMSKMQTTYYPRGIILSTGEDVPEGHSIRARMLIVELTPGDITADRLRTAQERRLAYPIALAGWVQWLAKDLKQHKEQLRKISNDVRDRNLEVGHSRTPPIMGDLIATLHLLIKYGRESGFIEVEEAARIAAIAEDAIKNQCERQVEFLNESDPTDAFRETIRQLLGSSLAHLKSKSGGIPEQPELMGWTGQHESGEVKSYKSNGPQIGWCDWDHDEIYIDVNSLPFIKRHASGKLSMTKQTLLKRLKDAGVTTRADDARQRNTLRMTCQGHQRNVIPISLRETVEAAD